MLSATYVKIRNRERISRDEGLFLLRRAELLDLAEMANEIRFEKNPEMQVTFVVDSNPNYTNICENDCVFCAFRRHPGEEDAYTCTVDQMMRRFKDAAARGATTILLQGGINNALNFDYYLEMIKRTIAEVPEVHPHFYSPPEIIGMSRISGFSIPEVLEKLWDAGMRTIPGGGAEVLSDRVKEKISKKKGTSADWLRVMRAAHRIGYKSTATMMYGHLETDEDILNHLESIRQLQDEYHGFTAFIPWSFKPGNTPLAKTITQRVTATRYLQIIAFSRIYLDNFPHIQASWFSEGKKTGQIALHFGADDFGGTLLEENVHAAADFINRTDTGQCVQMIHDAGFDAVQRSTLYEIIVTTQVATKAQRHKGYL
ncbi:MAG: dehypoxanthine futalosine cyclase [Syntrophaceae bacterium CG2_30_49_12]|nr:MAG: dehypoxanthine futalosine cyclase [Syntrophaceae bacterium CG2_30_49_12]PJA50356.1 MAG: dehypoxanthine futalosine cyclase [Syntrophobacterales bacterium CG_4_9_14_3_um_filter_49_8]PJC74466.1 MAG: dehypoxanthine futalosine cyclase [Syntrophobacterales bacterium CG_4_8_14_3_um_filter_49_14]